MKLITIGFKDVDEALDQMWNHLDGLCDRMAQDGYKLSVEPCSKGGYIFFSCHVHNPDLSFRSYEQVKDLIRQELSGYLAKYIAQVGLPGLTRRLAYRLKSHVSPEDWERVVQDSLIRLAAELTDPSLHDRLNQYFDQHFDVVVDGFINFRMKDFRQKALDVLHQTLEDLKLEQEYEEFIRVLRYFVVTQEPKLDQVHVLLQDMGRFEIVDEQGLPVNAAGLSPVDDPDMSVQDILVSQLIGLAPGTIILHVHQRGIFQEWVHTLKQVFGERIMICQGCEACYNSTYIPQFSVNKDFTHR